MTMEHNPDKDEMQRALDEEVREDEAVWDHARTAFVEFCNEHKGQPSGEVEKALHKWLRHHGIELDAEEVTSKASKIAAGETVELADLPSAPGSVDRPET